MMNVTAFGQALLGTGDLDPIYIMLWRARMDSERLARWCLAYWCFYHAGTSCRIVERADFWAAMRRADVERWPRGAERRHFRGRSSVTAIDWLASRFSEPADAVLSVVGPTFGEVSRKVRQWPQFGPWIAFKVADMLERVLDVKVDFGDCALSIYREPVAGAELVARELALPFKRADVVAAWLLNELDHPLAPPRYDRPVNIQEAETILCKYKAHRAGRYPVGKDTREIRHGLRNAGILASELIQFLPESVLEEVA